MIDSLIEQKEGYEMGNQQVSTFYSVPYDKRYFCDEHGNIYSVARGSCKRLTQWVHYGRSKSPYLRATIGGKHKMSHRLIVEAYTGKKIPEGFHVNHIDADTLNNSVSNLEVVTHKENVAHAVENRLYMSGDGWYRARGKTPTAIESTSQDGSE